MTTLDELFVPQPPYRMQRPHATLAVAEVAEEEKFAVSSPVVVSEANPPAPLEAQKSNLDEINDSAAKARAAIEEKFPFVDATPEESQELVTMKEEALKKIEKAATEATAKVREAEEIAKLQEKARKDINIYTDAVSARHSEAIAEDLKELAVPGGIEFPEETSTQRVRRLGNEALEKLHKFEELQVKKETSPEDLAFARREADESQKEAEKAQRVRRQEIEEKMPKLENLGALHQYILDSRKEGRSPTFIKGLEDMRRNFAEQAEKPRPEPNASPFIAENAIPKPPAVEAVPEVVPVPYVEEPVVEVEPTVGTVIEGKGKVSGYDSSGKADFETIPEAPTSSAESGPTAAEKRVQELEDELRALRAEFQAAKNRRESGAGTPPLRESEPGPEPEPEPEPTPAEAGDKGAASESEDDVRRHRISDEQGRSYWEKLKLEGSAGFSDSIAAISGMFASKWKERLKHRDEKIKKWEERGTKAGKDKGGLGALKAHMWDDAWANHHRSKGRKEYGKQEAWNDAKVRYENKRDEILSLGGARIDRILNPLLEQIDQLAFQRDEKDRLLDIAHAEHLEYSELLGLPATKEELEKVLETIAGIEKQLKDRAIEKRDIEKEWQSTRKRAAKLQAEKERLMSYSIRPSRQDTTPKAYTWHKQRMKRPGGSPKPRAGSRATPNVAA